MNIVGWNKIEDYHDDNAHNVDRNTVKWLHRKRLLTITRDHKNRQVVDSGELSNAYRLLEVGRNEVIERRLHCNRRGRISLELALAGLLSLGLRTPLMRRVVEKAMAEEQNLQMVLVFSFSIDLKESEQ